MFSEVKRIKKQLYIKRKVAMISNLKKAHSDIYWVAYIMRGQISE